MRSPCAQDTLVTGIPTTGARGIHTTASSQCLTREKLTSHWYINRGLVTPIKVPINRLKRFQRITLDPGENKTLTFKIPASESSFYDTKTNDFKTEPGMWEFQVGSSSQDLRLKKTFTVE
jgi:hypothetical protein